MGLLLGTDDTDVDSNAEYESETGNAVRMLPSAAAVKCLASFPCEFPRLVRRFEGSISVSLRPRCEFLGYVKVEILSHHPRLWTWKVCKDGTQSCVLAAQAPLSCAESAWDAGKKALKLLEQGLAVTVPSSAAATKRDIVLERRREGVARAKAEGRYGGRAPTARRQADEIHRLKIEGMKPIAIAERLGIGRATIYRILRSSNAASV